MIYKNFGGTRHRSQVTGAGFLIRGMANKVHYLAKLTSGCCCFVVIVALMTVLLPERNSSLRKKKKDWRKWCWVDLNYCVCNVLMLSLHFSHLCLLNFACIIKYINENKQRILTTSEMYNRVQKCFGNTFSHSSPTFFPPPPLPHWQCWLCLRHYTARATQNHNFQH